MLEIRNLSKWFIPAGRDEPHSAAAVDDVSLTVRQGELFTLLGPSGCGKTTTLRCVAGLEEPNRGQIELAGEILYSSTARISVPAHRRHLGMVFQSYAIWPHMTVFDNVAFPLRVRPRRQRPPAAEIRQRVMRILTTVRLDALAQRRATQLSGGQQQRLALARGLVTEPPLLMLDEPLSNLDLQLREEMRVELRRLQRELGVTTIYVTHDQVEALALSSRIAVMRAGRVEQVGTPEEIYRRPRTTFVAGFIGSSNMLTGQVRERVAGRLRVETPLGRLECQAVNGLDAGQAVVVFTRPQDLRLHRTGDTGARFGAVVEDRVFLGDSVEYVLRAGDERLRARSGPIPAFPVGDEVGVTFDDASCRVLPAG
jgi:iron(III) transport system ATP-binding protein